MSWLSAVLAASFALLLAVPARAASNAEVEQADALMHKGNQLRRAGDDQSALHEFKHAYAVARSPRTSAQLGLCEQAVGRFAEAEGHITDALKVTDDAWVNKNRATLENAVAIVREHVGRIEVVGEPAGAEVLINGSVAGTMPLPPVRVTEGSVDIEVRAAGYARATRTMAIGGGKYQKLVMRLDPAAGETHATEAAAASVADVRSSIDVPEAGSSPLRRSAKWIAWGGAAAMAGLGIYGVIHNSDQVTKFDDGCGTINGQPFAKTGEASTTCTDLYNSYKTAGTLAVVGFVGAGVLTGAGVALWLTEKPARGQPSVAWACAPGWLDGARLSCAARF